MDIKTALREGGVIGAGGAGFPAYAKQNPAADILLINGAECEPLVYTDYFLLREHLEDVIAGANALKAEGGYKEVVLSLEKKKAAKKLTSAEREKLIEQYTREMKEAARTLEFEKAAYLRDEIRKLREG